MRRTGNYSRVAGVGCVAGKKDKVESLDLKGLKAMVNAGAQRIRERREMAAGNLVRWIRRS